MSADSMRHHNSTLSPAVNLNFEPPFVVPHFDIPVPPKDLHTPTLTPQETFHDISP